MNLLANEFLQINNLQLGTLQFLFKEKSLKGVLQKTLSQFQDIYATHRLNFLNMTKRGEDIAILDEEKLRLVLGNLINNAVKYSEEGSEIEVSLSRKERWAVISVTDHGSGIAPEDLEKIFDKFYQGNASYKQGLGLGLYLVKQVVARHNGFMKAHSALGKGTTMSMYLPVVRV